ncbi:MAG TPA: SDR family oxidoreductase, partial [Novosphingobium sp.]
RADITDEAEVAALVAATVGAYGGLDVLVNNASPTEFQRGADRIDAPVTALAPEALERLWQGALFGHFRVCRHGIAAMVAAGRGGSVVNISSMVAVAGFAGGDGYTAAKGAINATTRSMAVEYAPHGIRVNAIVLGLILTSDAARGLAADPQASAGIRARQLTRFGQPEDIAHAALFLASDEAAFITGSELRADGGFSITGRFDPGPLAGGSAG